MRVVRRDTPRVLGEGVSLTPGSRSVTEGPRGVSLEPVSGGLWNRLGSHFYPVFSDGPRARTGRIEPVTVTVAESVLLILHKNRSTTTASVGSIVLSPRIRLPVRGAGVRRSRCGGRGGSPEHARVHPAKCVKCVKVKMNLCMETSTMGSDVSPLSLGAQVVVYSPTCFARAGLSPVSCRLFYFLYDRARCRGSSTHLQYGAPGQTRRGPSRDLKGLDISGLRLTVHGPTPLRKSNPPETSGHHFHLRVDTLTPSRQPVNFYHFYR